MAVSYILLFTLYLTLAASEETVTQSQLSATPEEAAPEKLSAPVQKEVLPIALAMKGKYGPLLEDEDIKKQLGTKLVTKLGWKLGDLGAEILKIEMGVNATKRRLLRITERLAKKIVALLYSKAWKRRLGEGAEYSRFRDTMKELEEDASRMQKILQLQA